VASIASHPTQKKVVEMEIAIEEIAEATA